MMRYLTRSSLLRDEFLRPEHLEEAADALIILTREQATAEIRIMDPGEDGSHRMEVCALLRRTGRDHEDDMHGIGETVIEDDPLLGYPQRYMRLIYMRALAMGYRDTMADTCRLDALTAVDSRREALLIGKLVEERA